MPRRSYRACAAKPRNDTGALAHDVAGPGHLHAGEPGRGSASVRSVRWPVLAGFSWSLAAAALRQALDASRAGQVTAREEDELGLAGALREEAVRLEQQADGLPITLHLPAQGLDGLPAAVEVAAYRIITEAVTNVLRHARARGCQISVRSGQDLALEVCDDGAGMPEGWWAGAGITAMRERVAELGGQLAVEPGRPRGTRITACLPAGRARQSGEATPRAP